MLNKLYTRQTVGHQASCLDTQQAAWHLTQALKASQAWTSNKLSLPLLHLRQWTAGSSCPCIPTARPSFGYIPITVSSLYASIIQCDGCVDPLEWRRWPDCEAGYLISCWYHLVHLISGYQTFYWHAISASRYPLPL